MQAGAGGTERIQVSPSCAERKQRADKQIEWVRVEPNVFQQGRIASREDWGWNELKTGLKI